jgi:hypothetical protein
MNEFGTSIWTVEGPEVNFFGFPYPTRMVVIRLDNGKSWIWSPINLSEDLVKEIESKAGPVKHIVSPNMIHHIFLKSWADRFPDAKVYAPPGLQERKQASTEGIRFDGKLGKDEMPFENEIDIVLVRGSYFMEEVEFFHKASNTAIICDLIQRHEKNLTGWKGFLMKVDGLAGEDGSTPREWRFSFWPFGKESLRQARDAMLNWKAEKLIIAHGTNAKSDATAVIEKALYWV